MGPLYGPLPALEGAAVWALELYKVHKGKKYARGPQGPYSGIMQLP